MEKTVSIIGVGNMGGGMALNLLSRGYAVYVNDVATDKESFFEQKGAVAGINTTQNAIELRVTERSRICGCSVRPLLAEPRSHCHQPHKAMSAKNTCKPHSAKSFASKNTKPYITELKNASGQPQ